MARNVVTRPGAPTSAYDSSTFSEWVQPDQQQAEMASGVLFTEDVPVEPRTEEISETRPDEPDVETYPDDINALATGLMAGFAGVPAAGNVEFKHTDWRLISGEAPGGDDDPFYYVHNYSGSRGGAVATPAAQTSTLRWKDSWLPPWPDDDAIGYEVETVDVTLATPNPAWTPESAPSVPKDLYSTLTMSLADPVSLDLRVTTQPVVSDGGKIGGLLLRATVNTGWGSGQPVYRNNFGVVFFEIDGPKPTYLEGGHDFGQAERAVAAQGLSVPVEWNFTVSNFLHAPPHTGLFGLSVGLTKDSITGSASPLVTVEVDETGNVAAGLGLTYSGVYTIRPPRIRWIYPDSTTPPPTPEITYRRVYPRDDALAGGASRTWPPSKAAQSSNRTFGGYL